MKRVLLRIAYLSILLCASHASLGARAAEPPASDPDRPVGRTQTLVVGAVSKDPKSRIPRLEAMSNYLAERLEDVGIRRGAVLIANNNAEMTHMLEVGAVDIVSETVFSGLHFAQEGVAEFLLREWKKGIAEYQTVFIAHRDSGIRSLEDLRGKKMAFEDAGSTSGFLLPLAVLKQSGLEAVEVPPRGKAPPGVVSYAFAIEEVNIAAWVARGIADAGAFNTQDWDDIGRTPEPLKEDLVIFHVTEPVMRSATLARTGLRADVKARVKQILLQMHEDPVGEGVLLQYSRVAKYDEILGEAASGLDRARQLYPFVSEEAR